MLFKLWFGFIAIAAVTIFVFGIQRYGTFISECMADGRKHYECQVMYQSTQPQTVIVHR